MKKNLIYILSAVVIVSIVVFAIWYFSSGDGFDVDVSDIDVEVKLERFDKEFAELSIGGNAYEKIEQLQKKYGLFFEVYNYDIIGIGGPESASYLMYVNTFLNDYSVVQASIEVANKYKSTKEIDDDLTSGFKHLKYYFPDVEIPRVVSFVAGFNHSVVITDGFIGVGLDKYLGADCKLYEMLEIPSYSLNEMVPEQIAIDVLTAWADAEYPFEPKTENLMEYMIYNGRKLYFLYAMFPDFARARINKYSDSQLAFCVQFERDMWTAMIENKLLFVTELLTIRKFTESAPFTAQFGPDSPPRAGNWLGLQIVLAYMKNNDVGLPELMAEKDYQKILNLSGYDPKYK
jgi:hypothetical protein